MDGKQFLLDHLLSVNQATLNQDKIKFTKETLFIGDPLEGEYIDDNNTKVITWSGHFRVYGSNEYFYKRYTQDLFLNALNVTEIRIPNYITTLNQLVEFFASQYHIDFPTSEMDYIVIENNRWNIHWKTKSYVFVGVFTFDIDDTTSLIPLSDVITIPLLPGLNYD